MRDERFFVVVRYRAAHDSRHVSIRETTSFFVGAPSGEFDTFPILIGYLGVYDQATFGDVEYRRNPSVPDR